MKKEGSNFVLSLLYCAVMCCGSADALVAMHRYSQTRKPKRAKFPEDSDDIISLTDTFQTKTISDSAVRYCPSVTAPISSEASLTSASVGGQVSRTDDTWPQHPLEHITFEPWISFEDMEAYPADSTWPYFPWQIQPPRDPSKVSAMWDDLERFKMERHLADTGKTDCKAN
ncbi:hypothetical protein AALO_G00209700 [Alosa alosa]|uniref:Uncharacterized protein n=1 Tax=Alosa alosa TaxID=278164 RepID=A0AAV6G3Z2_9TELE|nr:hypothetical protein AALO_G00209700 [Alosa alosa]